MAASPSVRPAGAGEGAREALEDLVLDQLEAGDRLPSEAELGSSLSVSRLTVREALKGLEARGLVTLHRGRRAVVRSPNGQLAADFFRVNTRRNPAAIFELIEVRRALEIQIAELAAARASGPSCAAMEAALGEMEALASTAEISAGDEERFHDADVRFHESLALATGNSMFILLIEVMAEPLRASRRRSWHGRVRDGRPLGPVVEAHRRILDQVAAGDRRGAAAAMRAHLDATERDLRSDLKGI